MFRRVICLILVMMLGPPFLNASDEISLSRYSGKTYNGSKSANAIFRVIYQKHEDNLEISLECDSGDYARRSGMSITKETPIEILFDFNLANGQYECIAILYRKNDKEFRARTSVLIAFQ